jgi:fructoselysine-6-P-deglycase FrlB-like protein
MITPDWHSDEFPELRADPPWVMQEMIAAEPEVVERLLREPPDGSSEAAEMIAAALAQHQPVTVCGCGTSEHAAHAIAALIAAAVGPHAAPLVQARPALTAALAPLPGVCLAISHDGGTRATALALQAARVAGAHGIAITRLPDSSVGRTAELTLVTPRHDDSWCHTIAYTSAIAAGAGLAQRLGSGASAPEDARDLLARATDAAGAPEAAARLAGRRVVLCAGAGADHISARELALKIAEGACCTASWPVMSRRTR